MQPLGTKVYLLKRYTPSDSFCTFFSESVLPAPAVGGTVMLYTVKRSYLCLVTLNCRWLVN